MALITFENLPSTNTPITAENLNNNFNELISKAHFYAYKGSAGNAWYHIASFTHDGSSQLSFDVEAFSNAPNVDKRGDWRLRIDATGSNVNNIAVSIIYGNRGINSDSFRVYNSTDGKTIDLYFYLPQWTRYEFKVYDQYLQWGDDFTVTPVLTAETPSGDVEIPIYGGELGYAKLYSNSNISAGTGKIAFDQLETNNSTKFIYYNNTIKIGKGISKIEVSGQLWIYPRSTTRQWIAIIKNGNTTVSTAIDYKSNYGTMNITPTSISVSEGDTIQFDISNLQGGNDLAVSDGSGNPSIASYLFVKEI